MYDLVFIIFLSVASGFSRTKSFTEINANFSLQELKFLSERDDLMAITFQGNFISSSLINLISLFRDRNSYPCPKEMGNDRATKNCV